MSCEHLLEALKDCLRHSDCVVKQKILPSDCLRHHMDELPKQCQGLRQAVFECKRSQLDMRRRFRGKLTGGPPRDLSDAPPDSPST